LTQKITPEEKKTRIHLRALHKKKKTKKNKEIFFGQASKMARSF
jgi:hypothetical protein